MAGREIQRHCARMTFFPAIGRQMLRKGRASLRDHVYLVTTTTRHRVPVFADHDRARLAARIIASRSAWGDATLLAWVLMPDHWHGLVQLRDDSLERVICRFKSAVTRAMHDTGAWNGPCFDRSFHDRTLRRDQGLRTVARYIVGNPMRAGLVDEVMDYPYWDAVWLDVE